MKTKFYVFLTVAIVVGLTAGYLVGSIPLQHQINSLEIQLDEQNQQIAQLQANVTEFEDMIEEQNNQIEELEAGVHEGIEQIGFLNDVIVELERNLNQRDSYIASLEEIIGGLVEQINSMHTLRINILDVAWDVDADTATVTVENTGTQNVTIESLQAYTNSSGWMIDTSTDATGILNVGQSNGFLFDVAQFGWDVQPSDEFTIIATCSAGFSTETFSTVPNHMETDLVQNGGFETGDFTSWTPSAQNENVTIVSGTAYEGTYCLTISGQTSVGQALNQTTMSKITFWGRCSNSSESSYIVIFFYGTDAYSIAVGPISGTWNRYEVESSIAYNEFSISTSDDSDPVYIYPEEKMIDSISILP